MKILGLTSIIGMVFGYRDSKTTYVNMTTVGNIDPYQKIRAGPGMSMVDIEVLDYLKLPNYTPNYHRKKNFGKACIGYPNHNSTQLCFDLIGHHYYVDHARRISSWSQCRGDGRKCWLVADKSISINIEFSRMNLYELTERTVKQLANQILKPIPHTRTLRNPGLGIERGSVASNLFGLSRSTWHCLAD